MGERSRNENRVQSHRGDAIHSGRREEQKLMFNATLS
jgi:hypothetical protein